MSSKESNKNDTKTSPTTPFPYPLAEQRAKSSSVDMLAGEKTADDENSITNKDDTPPPRNIRLIRYTPNSKVWKKETEQPDTYKSSPLAPSSSNRSWASSQEKLAPKLSNDVTDLAEASAQTTKKNVTRATDSKLLELLRSKSTVGNFHNVTLHKSELKSAPRNTNTIPAFISANNTARIRSDISPGANSNDRKSNIFMSSIKTVLNNCTSPVRPIIASNQKFSFTSNVKELLQNDGTSNATSKDDKSLSLHDKDIENGRKELSQVSVDKSVIETKSINTITDKRAIGLPIASILNEDDSGIQSFGMLGDNHNTVESMEISSGGDDQKNGMKPGERFVPPEGNNTTVRVHEKEIDSNQTISLPISHPYSGNAGTGESQTVDRATKDTEQQKIHTFQISDQIKEERTEIPVIHSEEERAAKEESVEGYSAKSKPSNGNFPVNESSKTASQTASKVNKTGVQDEVVEKDEISIGSSKIGESQGVHSEGAASSEKWSAALNEEMPTSDSRHRDLVHLFSSIRKTNLRNQGNTASMENFFNMLSTAKITLNADLAEAQRGKMESLENGDKTNDDNSVLMEEEKGPESTSNIQLDHHYLKGSIVSFPFTPAPRGNEEATMNNLNTAKMELVYITEQEESATSSDGERENILKTFPSKTRSSKLARRQYFAQRRVVAPSSGIAEHSSHSSSPKRELPKLIDPGIERRKFDRDFSTKVLTKLGDKHLYDRNTIAELIQEGVTGHTALCDNMDASVTNNVCSVNNYEISHAYYYQQMPRRGKLEYIPLHGQISAEYQEADNKEADNKEAVVIDENVKEHEKKVATASISESSSFKVNVDHDSKENWKQEWHSKLKACRIFFDTKVVPNSVTLGKDPIAEQCMQLKNIFQEKLGAKVTDLFDSSVDIVILPEASKCDKENNIVLSDSTQVPRESTSGRKVRIWCVDKAFQFLENIGVDPKEWNTEQEVIVEMPIRTPEGAETTLEEELSDDEDDGENWPCTMPDGASNTDLSKKLPTLELAKAPIVCDSVTPSSSAESTEEDDNDLDVNMDTMYDVQYLEELLQAASSAMDKRDNDLKAAQKLILALSREVLQNQLKITSLTGQLTAAEKEAETQRAVVSDYKDIISQQEEHISGLAKRRWEGSPECVNNRSVSPVRKTKKLQK